MSEIFNFEKSPLEELCDLLPGMDDSFRFTLNESQRSALSFAALCEAESLAECHEAHEPEVQEAVRSLHEARRILEQGRQP